MAIILLHCDRYELTYYVMFGSYYICLSSL